MPELPDVEALKQYAESHAPRKKVVDVEVKDDTVLDISPGTLERRIKSRSFGETKRIGKHLFLSAGDDKWLMLHFGMTGGLAYTGEEDEIPRHSRILFYFNDNGCLSYTSQRKLGTVSVTDRPAEFREKHGLGNDALDVGREEFRQLLGEKNSMIKPALMDQGVIAGLGNVYSDEILYQTKIHPETKTGGLSEGEVNELHRNMRRILKTSISNDADPNEMPDHYLISHREEGAECPDCTGNIKRIKVSGRGCYICPDCQEHEPG